MPVEHTHTYTRLSLPELKQTYLQDKWGLGSNMAQHNILRTYRLRNSEVGTVTRLQALHSRRPLLITHNGSKFTSCPKRPEPISFQFNHYWAPFIVRKMDSVYR
jgi:hypothetical protein